MTVHVLTAETGDQTTAAAEPAGFRGWILYDGRCGLCRSGARKLGRVAVARGFRLAPLQRAWVRRRLAMDEAELLIESRVLTPDGQLIGGAAMYVHLGRFVWWARPLVAIASLPGGMTLLNWIYVRIARNRHCISGACRLDQRIHAARRACGRRSSVRRLTRLFNP